MKVLVTGASGYIGGQTAIQLKDQGHEVYGLDIRPLPKHLIKLELFSEFAQDNFASNDAITWIVNHNFDAIIHCAGTSLVGPSMTNPQLYYANNFVGSFSTMDFTLSKKIDFDTSSVTAYLNVQNAFNAIPPDVIGSSGNPGGINTPIGEDLMGRYFIIGIRGNL